MSHKFDPRQGALHEGDAVRVFSQSADVWVVGEVVKIFEDDFVCVDYEVDEHRHRKSLHLCSVHLDIPLAIGDEECDSDQSKFADEERKYDRLLRIEIETKGKDHTDVATARCNLGIIYEKQSRFVDAMRENEETLRFRMATLGEDHLDVAATRNNIARALLEAKRRLQAVLWPTSFGRSADSDIESTPTVGPMVP